MRIAEPKSKPQATGLLELSGVVEPVDHPDASISSMGETTKEKLEILLVKLREWSRKALRHLLSYDEVAKYDPPPVHFPKLQRVYLQQRIALVEDRTRDLTGELRAAMQSMMEKEERLAQFFPT